MNITAYIDSSHRMQVINLWDKTFGYPDARNKPSLVIDKKIAVGDGLFFVAEEHGQVVGTIMAGYDGHRGWIYSLAVSEAHRHKDIGTFLLSRAESELANRGCVKINLQVVESNSGVCEFYTKNGYHVEPRISMGKSLVRD